MKIFLRIDGNSDWFRGSRYARRNAMRLPEHVRTVIQFVDPVKNENNTIELIMHMTYNVGRADDNHIILDDSAVSRHQCQLRHHFGGKLQVKNQSTTHPTEISRGQQEIHTDNWTPLRDGDGLIMGTTIVWVAIQHAL